MERKYCKNFERERERVEDLGKFEEIARNLRIFFLKALNSV
jgi:hypothetical protein